MKLKLDKKLSGLTPSEKNSLLDRGPADEPQLRDQVRGLLNQVRTDGDDALRAMTKKFDGVELETLEVPRARWEEALRAMDPALRSNLE